VRRGTPDRGGSVLRTIRVDIDWHARLPVFASDRYLRLVGSEYGWLGGVDDGGDLACLLPFVVIKRAVFRLVRFPVETILLKAGINADKERAFLNGAVEHFRSMKVDLIVPATSSSLFRTFPDGALVAPYGNLVIDLTQSEEALWQAMHHKHRNVIRNAGRQGVLVKCGMEHLDTAYHLTLASLLRSAGGPVGRRRIVARMRYADFARVVRGLDDHVRVLVADHDGVAQSAAVIPYSTHSAYYMHGGSIAKPVSGASNLLQWSAIRMFRDMGVQRYNFFGVRVAPETGSKAEGLRKFKERFGGEFVSGFMWKLPFSPVKYALYELAARMRNGGDVVDQERNLGNGSPYLPKIVTDIWY
jgi:hypothetical protein